MLPLFLGKLLNPGKEEYRFSVRVKLARVRPMGEASHAGKTPVKGEMAWIGELSPIPESRLIGTLLYEPRDTSLSLHQGQIVTFPLSAVSDWSYSCNGILVGRHMDRAMMQSLPAMQRWHMMRLLGWL